MTRRSKKLFCIIISAIFIFSAFSMGIYAIDTGITIEEDDYYSVNFIKNSASGLFLNAFDSVSLNQASFTGKSNQAWIFTECNTGYYTIMNKSTGTYLTSPANPEDGAVVSLESYIPVTSSYECERQTWKFVELENGKYLIQSRSMESYGLYLSHSGYMGWYGYEVIIDPYWPELSEYAYYLEWEIGDYTIDDFDYRLLAYEHLLYLDYNSNPVTPEIFLEPTATMLTSYRSKAVFSYLFDNISSTDMIEFMNNSEVFVISTHGQYDSIMIRGDLVEYEISGEIIEVIENEVWMKMSQLDNVDLSNLKLALLLSCSTGTNYDKNHILLNKPVNFVEKMVCQGAETVVGFNISIYSIDANSFGYDLMEQLALSNNITKAINNIKYDGNYEPGFQDYIVVAGNENLILT